MMNLSNDKGLKSSNGIKLRGKMKVRKRNVKKSIIILGILLLLFVFTLANTIVSCFGLTVTYYDVQSDTISEAIRIVQLTDLHNSEFGDNNERLVEKVSDQDPDLILITGDLMNSSDESIDIAITLIQKLSEIAPVYFSYGNHEKDYEINYEQDITELFTQAGACILEYSYADIEVNGQELRIGGIYGYCIPESFLQYNEGDAEECAFLDEFQATDRYTILLCHMPYSWIENNGISEWDIDCVFTGHVHGGQIRIPFIGGLWAPDQGWFPGEECGLYYSDDNEKVMVLSRGLGSTENIPRFNNIPEIVVVDLIPSGS